MKQCTLAANCQPHPLQNILYYLPTHLTKTLPHEVALNQNILANGFLKKWKIEKAGYHRQQQRHKLNRQRKEKIKRSTGEKTTQAK